jgi:hypothetical protein
MENGKKLVVYTNIIAACILIIFSIESYLKGYFYVGNILLAIAALFGLAYTLTIFKKYSLSKIIFIITSNITAFCFDEGIEGKGGAYLFYIPLILSYFVIFKYTVEKLKIFGSIFFTFSVLFLANSTNLSPHLGAGTSDDKWLDFALTLIASVVVVLVLVNSNRRYNNRLEGMACESRQLHSQLRAVFDNGVQNLVLVDNDFKVVLADKKSVAHLA